ncbi:DUF6437 family protein [Parvularcula maris]|uniref:DUF6437 family protein n=1 Tax=Parvularcula maris TaxID=2965077 RepID=A0A9X2RL68_9PROT|nr:DUF6437 family protein [Parvularcula maris]
MPAKKNPIAELEAHRAKQESLAKKAKQIEADAAQHLGRLVMASKLHAWKLDDLAKVLAKLSELGPEESVRRMSRSEGRASPPSRGDDAKPPVTDKTEGPEREGAENQS